MKRLCILMSTYNGEKYINCQINSILAQVCELQIDILIRDDSSNDNTRLILSEYSRDFYNIKFYFGENLGACGSFFDLINHVDNEYDYFAFSDQDDFWLKEKMSKAIEAIQMQEKKDNVLPCLYSCMVSPVNENLEKINYKYKTNELKPAFGNAVIENICTGCTCLMNKNLFNLIRNNTPNNVFMHDSWIYLVASCFGVVIVDMNSYILYRQHANNAIGIPKSFIRLMVNRIRNFNKNKNIIRKQLTEFNRLYILEGDNKMIVDYILLSKESIKRRFNILFNRKIFRQNKFDTIIFKVLFMLGL